MVANLSPLRYIDPDGRVIVDEATGEVTVEENDTTEDLMFATAVYAQYISPERRGQLGRILEANEFASARGELTAEEFEKQNRAALYSALTLGLQDARGGLLGERQDQAVLEAYSHLRADGRRVVGAARDASKQGYEATELAAGLLGVPTSKTDVGLMAIPVVGGAIRITTPALKSVFGIIIRSKPDDAGRTLAKLAGTKGYEGVEFFPHIGASAKRGRSKGGNAPWNPEPKPLNCVNTVCAFLETARDKEMAAGEALKDVAWNGGSIENVMTQIHKRIGIKRTTPQFNTLNTTRDEQFFVVFTGSNRDFSEHVLVGISKKNERTARSNAFSMTLKAT